jgi:hypothetical protein
MALPPSKAPSPPSGEPAVKKLGAVIDRPVELDQVRLDADGRMWPRPGSGPLRFTFADRGRRFLGRLVRVGEVARLHVAGEIAAIPYTVESPAARSRLLAALRAARRPALGRLAVGPGQTICVEGELAFDAPVTPNRLIAAAALFVAATRQAADQISAAAGPAEPKRR